MRTIVILAFEGANLLDITGPQEAFSTVCRAAPAGGDAPYRPVVCSAAGATVHTSAGLALVTKPIGELEHREIDTLVIPGGHASLPPVPHDVTDWVKQHAGRIRRVCSVCTGAFILAAAGLLDGRRATTHWMAADQLRSTYPGVHVEPDRIFIRDGAIWTSAGVSAGIDLSLALIEDDLGHAAAMQAARRMVVFLKRPGGQSQFSAPLAAQSEGAQRFADLHAWISAHLADDLRVDRLAWHAHMSPRTFARLYAAHTGRTPAKAVEILRMEAACRALEEDGASLKRVAARCGFGDEQNLRRAFQRRLGISPAEYRQRFAAGSPTR